MKTFAKWTASLLACLFLLSAAGCSARSPIDAAAFQTMAEDAGFTVTQNDTAGNTTITAYSTAKDAAGANQVDFVVFDTASNATELYNNLKKQLPTEGVSAKTNVDSAAYTKCTVSIDEVYYVVVRLENTVAYAYADQTGKDMVNSLFQAMKY